MGRRSSTVYAITPKGRSALAEWLSRPGSSPVLEYEQLFFAEHGTKSEGSRAGGEAPSAPLAEAHFVSLEDELGFIPLIVWPSSYEEYKRELREPFMMVEGSVSRREGTLNIVVQKVTIPRVPGTSVTGNIKLPRPVFR